MDGDAEGAHGAEPGELGERAEIETRRREEGRLEASCTHGSTFERSVDAIEDRAHEMIERVLELGARMLTKGPEKGRSRAADHDRRARTGQQRFGAELRP